MSADCVRCGGNGKVYNPKCVDDCGVCPSCSGTGISKPYTPPAQPTVEALSIRLADEVWKDVENRGGWSGIISAMQPQQKEIILRAWREIISGEILRATL